MRKALCKFIDLFGFTDRDNHISAEQLDDCLGFLWAVYHHYRIESSTPQCVSEPDRIAKGFMVGGVNCPRDPQGSVANINARSLHGEQFVSN